MHSSIINALNILPLFKVTYSIKYIKIFQFVTDSAATDEWLSLPLHVYHIRKYFKYVNYYKNENFNSVPFNRFFTNVT